MNLYEVVELKCCDYCINDKIKRNFACCNHFVFRLNTECEDNRTKKSIDGLLNIIPFGCYFKILKTDGTVLAYLQ